MKAIFDNISDSCNKTITKAYSTSFSLATKMLHTSIRQDIYNIYGFVRLADEIVDSFHDYDKITLFERLKKELDLALDEKISINPILNSFQNTVHKYNIERHLIYSFMKSMEQDLSKSVYNTDAEYKEYIYGSADVVGLMCLQIFVKGDEEKYHELKDGAMHLGSAFQKINFLRDLKEDQEELNRMYFPNTNLDTLDETSKKQIILEIESDLAKGYQGIINLPVEAKFGVYMAYRYYKRLLKKLNKVPAIEIKNTRVRVANHNKIYILTRSYVKYQLNLVK
ncbi:MAG: phytoene synthase [Flavobacteriaceae bacterium]|jgi:phytoene synthase|uniref:phytoene/squalene synthase family protein n=1 Tax=Candidatus Marifrigoribacter sp. Uisw_064 TaxID=3230970 RepID=UPI003ADD7CBC